MAFGKKQWAIAEGYIPKTSNGPSPEMESHETVCILNTTSEPANVEILIYFSDKKPSGPYAYIVSPQRTLHLRFNDFVPKGIDFASTIISDVPIIVQHTRLDSRQAANALLSTIAYSE